jgi:hypothetical protein
MFLQFLIALKVKLAYTTNVLSIKTHNNLFQQNFNLQKLSFSLSEWFYLFPLLKTFTAVIVYDSAITAVSVYDSVINVIIVYDSVINVIIGYDSVINVIIVYNIIAFMMNCFVFSC